MRIVAISNLPPRMVQSPLSVRRTSGIYRVAKMKVMAVAKVIAVAPVTLLDRVGQWWGEHLLGFLQLRRLKKKLW